MSDDSDRETNKVDHKSSNKKSKKDKKDKKDKKSKKDKNLKINPQPHE